MVFSIMERLGICYSVRKQSQIEYRFPSLLQDELLAPLPALSGPYYGVRLQWKYLTDEFRLPIPRTLFSKVQAALASSTHFGYPGRSDRMKAARDSVRLLIGSDVASVERTETALLLLVHGPQNACSLAIMVLDHINGKLLTLMS